MRRDREDASCRFAFRIPVVLVVSEGVHYINAGKLFRIQHRKICTPIVKCRNIINRISGLYAKGIFWITCFHSFDCSTQICSIICLNVSKDEEICLCTFFCRGSGKGEYLRPVLTVANPVVVGFSAFKAIKLHFV